MCIKIHVRLKFGFDYYILFLLLSCGKRTVNVRLHTYGMQYISVRLKQFYSGKLQECWACDNKEIHSEGGITIVSTFANVAHFYLYLYLHNLIQYQSVCVLCNVLAFMCIWNDGAHCEQMNTWSPSAKPHRTERKLNLIQTSIKISTNAKKTRCIHGWSGTTKSDEENSREMNEYEKVLPLCVRRGGSNEWDAYTFNGSSNSMTHRIAYKGHSMS